MALLINQTMRLWQLAITVLLCGPGLPVGPAIASLQDCLRASRIAAAETGVPEAVLDAVMLVETGWQGPEGFGPWAWTTNEAGIGKRFSTQAAAGHHAREVIASGRRNIDLGCFQINFRWHGASFASLDDMLEPVTNARYAARLLHRHWQRTGDWLLAAGAYHSATPELAAQYRSKVAKAMTSGTPDAATPVADADRRLIRPVAGPVLIGTPAVRRMFDVSARRPLIRH